MRGILSLTCLESLLGLVDHVDPALAAHHTTIAVTLLERAKRVSDLHGPLLFVAARRGAVLQFVPGTGVFRRAGAHGGRYWDRTSDPYDVNVVLYR